MNILTLVFYLLSLIMIYGCALCSLYHHLTFLQQAHYNFNSFKVLLKKEYKSYRNLLLLPIITWFLNISKYQIYIYILTFIFLISFLILKLEEKFTIKLKFTSRIIRLILINVLIYSSVFVFSRLIYPIDVIILYLIPIFSFVTLLVTYPFELIINSYFHLKAHYKIKKINPLIIGITGSAGKTTTKSLLYQMLKNDYVVFATPKSYNTVNGISKSINEEMSAGTQIAIIEYGASQKNDIKKSLRVCGPNISIITNIRSQHLETFKTIENTIREKTRIINSSDFHVATAEKRYVLPDIKTKIISNNPNIECDYSYFDIVYKDYKMNFKIIDKESNKVYQLQTNLLGKNNCENILFCIAVMRYMGYKMERIKCLLEKCYPFEHRLEIKEKIKNKVIVDDSFNSNREGFLEAIDVITMFPGNHGLITPGVVSGGKEMKRINEEIALYVIQKRIYPYVVESCSSEYFEKRFNEFKYEYTKTKNFKEAYLLALENNNLKTILIENDITDYFKK